MSEHGYNGFQNYATWVTKCWLDNDESGFVEHNLREIWEQTRSYHPDYEFEESKSDTIYEFATSLENYHDERLRNNFPMLYDNANVFADLFNHQYFTIDWQELAETYFDDFMENEEDIEATE